MNSEKNMLSDAVYGGGLCIVPSQIYFLGTFVFSFPGLLSLLASTLMMISLWTGWKNHLILKDVQKVRLQKLYFAISIVNLVLTISLLQFSNRMKGFVHIPDVVTLAILIFVFICIPTVIFYLFFNAGRDDNLF